MDSIIPQIVWNSLIAGSLYALAAGALAMQYSLLKILNFSLGQVMALGAYLLFLSRVLLDLSWLSSILIVVFGVTLISFITLRLFVDPFIRKGAIVTFITTLTLGIILENSLQLYFGASVKSLSTTVAPAIDLGFFQATSIQLFIVAIAAVVLLLLAVVMSYTGLGRRLRAIAESTERASSLGIKARRISYQVVIFTLLLAAFAGILVGFESNLQPQMGFSYTIKAFTAMILGGLGNIWGTIFGAYLISFIENFGIGLTWGGYSIPSGMKDSFSFFIILLVLLFRPWGLFGSRQRTS